MAVNTIATFASEDTAADLARHLSAELTEAGWQCSSGVGAAWDLRRQEG